MGKVPGTRTAGENEAMKAYKEKGAKLIAKLVDSRDAHLCRGV